MKLGLKLGLSKNQAINSNPYGWPLIAPGAKIINAGDSITKQSLIYTSNGLTLSNRTNGILLWGMTSCPAYQHVNWYDAGSTGEGAVNNYSRGANYGYEGFSATDLYGFIDRLVNSGANIADLLIGTNTGTTDAGAAAKIESIDNIITDLHAADIFVIISTILPRGCSQTPTGAEISPTQMAPILTTNEYIRTLNGPMTAVCDPWELLRNQAYDPDDPEYGDVAAGMTHDRVHLTPLGAYTASKPKTPIIRQLCGGNNLTWFNSNPTVGSLNSNGNFTGTSGSKTGNTSGTLATNFTTGSAGTNSSMVVSQVANALTGGNTQRLAVTSLGDDLASTTTDNLFLQMNSGQISYASMSTGDWMQLFVKVKVSGNGAGALGSLVAYINDSTASRFARAFDQSSTGLLNRAITTEDWEGWLQTEPIQYTAGNTYFYYLFLQVLKAKAGTVQVDVEAMMVRKVEAPSATFPFNP